MIHQPYYPLHLAYTIIVRWRCKFNYKIIYYFSFTHPQLTHIFKTVWYATWDYTTSLSTSCRVFFSSSIVLTTIFSSVRCSTNPVVRIYVSILHVIPIVIPSINFQLLNISISTTIFCWSIKSLCNLYHDPPSSAYNPSSLQYYRPTMPSQVSDNQSDDNEVEGTNDDIPPPPPPTIPCEQQP